MALLKKQDFEKANKLGLAGADVCFYSPLLNVAFDLGCNGQSIDDCEIINCFRFGGLPDTGVSHNHASDCSEKGLSVYTDSDVIRAEFEERGNKVELRGIKVATGSDGEPVVLPLDIVESWD